VTDYDSWKVRTVQKDGKVEPAPPLDPNELLSEIIANLKSASANAAALMKKTVELIAANRDRLATSPAQHALRLAIWSDKSKIDPDEVQRLGPLWLKYFVGS
jgi:5'-methylthioadenosine phosphorylase